MCNGAIDNILNQDLVVGIINIQLTDYSLNYPYLGL